MAHERSTAQSPAAREQFSSRLGFILISAGCAIGLGNVWRFPFVVGQNGGAAFVLIYLVFLVILGLPVMIMEFAVGRASRQSAAAAFDTLAGNRRWHWFGWWGYLGCMMLMMFYTTVGGWMLSYIPRMAAGEFSGMDAAAVGAVFNGSLADPAQQVLWMLLAVGVGFVVCSFGLQNGVERITKVMMLLLLSILVILVVRSVTLPGADAGLAFYLIPDFGQLFAGETRPDQLASFATVVYAAMGQAFFTLSLGISSMEVFGSYIGKDRTLPSEAARIVGLDTFVALMAGLLIFPACFAFGVNPGEGPGLIFVTLPSVFNQMPMGQLWGALFFVFMSFAALSTIIAVFENLIACIMDQWGWTRKKSVVFNGVLVALLSLPCALGFNVLAGVDVPGIGNIQAIEDFIVSSNLLPLGSLIYIIFCMSRKGWGWKNFRAEADTGAGAKFPVWARGWVSYGIPVLIIIIFLAGYAPKVAVWLGMA